MMRTDFCHAIPKVQPEPEHKAVQILDVCYVQWCRCLCKRQFEQSASVFKPWAWELRLCGYASTSMMLAILCHAVNSPLKRASVLIWRMFVTIVKFAEQSIRSYRQHSCVTSFTGTSKSYFWLQLTKKCIRCYIIGRLDCQAAMNTIRLQRHPRCFNMVAWPWTTSRLTKIKTNTTHTLCSSNYTDVHMPI